MKRVPIALLIGAALVAGCSEADSNTSSNGTLRLTTPTITAEPSTPLTTPPESPAVPACSNVPTAIEGTPSLTGDVMLVDELGNVLSIDVESGEVTCVRPYDAARAVYESNVEPAPWVQGDPAGVVRVNAGTPGSLISTGGVGGGNWYVPDDPAENAEVESMYTPPVSFFPTDDPGIVWLVIPDTGEVMLVGPIVEGHLLGTISLGSGEHAIAADGLGGLVIESGDSTLREYRTLSTEGAMTPVWTGFDLVAVGTDTIVGITCESEDACRLNVVNRTSGDVVDLGVAPAAFTSGQDFLEQYLTLSPDQTLLATPTVEGDLYSATTFEDGPMVIDVTNGSVAELDGGVWPMSTHNLTWSTAGSVLYWIDADGGFRAWSPADPDRVMQLGADVLPTLRNVIIDE
jgi:hypothetical protein